MLSLPIISSHNRHLSTSEPPPVSPTDLGLPSKFIDWRSEQWNGVQRIIDSSKRFVVVCAPTGAGKTIISMAAAILTGRTVVLTATRGLQDQISGDFETLSADIRGLNNYLCPITESLGIPKDTSVADAPCQCGYGCGLRRGGCTYYDRYRVAQEAGIVSTNYQCWLYDGARQGTDRGNLQFGLIPDSLDAEEDLRIRDKQKARMLICDEAHDLLEQLSMFLGVEFSRRECLFMKLDWPDAGLTVDDWQQWAIEWQAKVDTRILIAEQKLKSSGGKLWSTELKHLRDMKRKLDRLSGMQAIDGWILNETATEGRSMTGVRFDPLNPARYAEQSLWRGVDKIVLVSATVRPKTAELLGIKPEDLEFVEYGSSFDPKRRPVVYVPSERMTYHTEQDDQKMRWWLSKFDDVVERNLHHKGIVHCVSYRRMKFIYDNSKYREHMMIHNSYDRASVIEAFRRREAPAILLSPAVDTGYDFPNRDARWQIISKIPFASVQDRVIKARQEQDKEYGMYLAAQTLIQACGRIVRSGEDWGATYILDGNWEWFQGRARRYFPKWFQEAVVWVDNVPEPLEFDEPKIVEDLS